MRRTWLSSACALAAAIALIAACAATASAAPFEPIALKHVPVPAGLTHAGAPVFTADGEHLLFNASPGSDTTKVQLWSTTTDGGDAHCLSCANGPDLPLGGILNPFPDGRRIFVGFAGIFECSPSVLDCQSHTFLPLDLAGSKPPGGIIFPGGAATAPQLVVGQGASPKLAPDGEHVGYSDIRTDGFEEMVVAKLVRGASNYTVTDAKVINPAGPASATDPDVDHWSETSALFELKTFTHGGADVTYVQGGGQASENPDIWEVNLATGARRRLTANPDWDEDDAISPDGRTLAVWSNRTLHYWDYLGGLLPVRSFIDMPMVAAEAGLLINTPNNLTCAGPYWLLPGEGDHGGTLAGQPIVDGVDPDAYVTDSVAGWPMWNPQSTMIALDTMPTAAGLFGQNTLPYMMVAHLTARTPSTPEPVVSSDVGGWAPAPADWHPAFGFVGTVTLHGPGGGTVTVTYNGNPGGTYGSFSETYDHYSDDGHSFVDGTTSIDVLQPSIGKVHKVSHLTMTGAHTGSTDIDLTVTGGAPDGTAPFSDGHATVTYDGTTVTGPPAKLNTKGACPQEEQMKAPQLQAATTHLGGNDYTIAVTAAVAGVGANEAATDTEPVTHARVAGDGIDALTGDDGSVRVTVPSGRTTATPITINAGDTLQPTSITLPPTATAPAPAGRRTPPAPVLKLTLNAADLKHLRTAGRLRGAITYNWTQGVRVQASLKRADGKGPITGAGAKLVLVRAGKTAKFELRLTAKAKRALGVRHTLRLTVTVRARPGTKILRTKATRTIARR